MAVCIRGVLGMHVVVCASGSVVEIVADGQGGLWQRGGLGVEVCGGIAWLDVSGEGVM